LTTGFPVLTLTLFVCSIVWLWRRPEANRSVPLMRAIAAATIVTWALTLHAGPFSAYPIVYYGFPGAKVIRVLARYQLFLAVPVIALGTAFLAGQAKRLPRWLVLALSVLLLAEQINRFPIRWIDRPAELARMAAVPAAPAGCAAFFISREEKDPWSPVDGLYRHSVDAMLLAELRRLPTINGIASFLPPDYDLFNPDQPAYVDKVRRYSAEHDLQGLCGLDFRTKTWQTSP
jgi:hypothetical protein